MTEERLYSRAELAAIAQCPDDALTFWLRHGLLRSEARGARKHRRFASTEVKLAALLREARAIGLNIGAMTALVAGIREALALHATIPKIAEKLISDRLGDIISAIQDGSDESFDRLKVLGFIDSELAQSLAACRSAFSQHDAPKLWLADVFLNDGECLAIYRDPDGEWKITYEVDQNRLPGSATVAFDLHQIFDLDWASGERTQGSDQ